MKTKMSKAPLSKALLSLSLLTVLSFAQPGAASAAQPQPPASSRPAAPSTPKAAPPVRAQDALTRCLIESTSEDEKRILVKWVFSVIAQHPDIASMTRIDTAQRTAIDRDAAAVFETLLADQCASPLRVAMKQSGTDAIGRSFQALGTSAATDMLQNPQVVSSGAGLMKHLDMQRILMALIAP
jgi:hypothetical protein